MSVNLIQDISMIVPCICVKPTKITIYPPESYGIKFIKPGTLVEILELAAFYSSDKNKRICKLYDEISEEFDNEEIYLCSNDAFEPIIDERLYKVIKGMKELYPRSIVFKNKTQVSALKLFENVMLNFIDDAAQTIIISCQLTSFGKKPTGTCYYLGFDVEFPFQCTCDYEEGLLPKTSSDSLKKSILITPDKLFEPIRIKKIEKNKWYKNVSNEFQFENSQERKKRCADRPVDNSIGMNKENTKSANTENYDYSNFIASNYNNDFPHPTYYKDNQISNIKNKTDEEHSEYVSKLDKTNDEKITHSNDVEYTNVNFSPSSLTSKTSYASKLKNSEPISEQPKAESYELNYNSYNKENQANDSIHLDDEFNSKTKIESTEDYNKKKFGIPFLTTKSSVNNQNRNSIQEDTSKNASRAIAVDNFEKFLNPTKHQSNDKNQSHYEKNENLKKDEPVYRDDLESNVTDDSNKWFNTKTYHNSKSKTSFATSRERNNIQSSKQNCYELQHEHKVNDVIQNQVDQKLEETVKNELNDFENIDIQGLIRLKCMNTAANCKGILFIEGNASELFKCELCHKFNCLNCNVIHDGERCHYSIEKSKKKSSKTEKEYQKSSNEKLAKEQYVCEKCCKTLNDKTQITLNNCFHKFCKPCLQERIKDQAKDGIVVCPRQTKECLAQLNEMEIKKICDKKVYKIYDSARKFRNVKCPHCKEQFLFQLENNKNVNCVHCNRKIQLRKIDK